MNKEQFLDVMDDIGDDIIENFLDIPSERFYIPKRTPFWKIAVSTAAAVCVLATGIFAAVKIHITQSSAVSSSSEQQAGTEIINSDKFATLTEPVAVTIVNEKTGKGFTGKIYYEAGDQYYRRFYSSTDANFRAGYIYAGVLLENSLNNAYIGSYSAYGRNKSSADVYAAASYGRVTYVRVTGTHKGGNSEDELKSDFRLCKIFVM